ncbi:MAG: adenylate/guanylate cyclase domain-containing protein, partial [Acidobacteriota bacterium]
YSLKSTGWFVLIEVDAADIFSAIRALIGVLLTVTSGGILIAIGLGYFFSRRFITDRVFAVSSAARQVSKGNLSARVRSLGDDEIGQLGKSFNQMMEGLVARQREKEVFGHYLSTTIRDKILKHPDALSGEDTEAAVLFSDIRDFSAYSETRPPHEVVNMLNRHFSRMVKVIQDNGGVVEKFIGDAVMAVFSEYFGTTDPHRSAVKAAVAMRRELADLNLEFAGEGKQTIDIGTGIHAGPVVAGNIGSVDRKNFTVIGNTVDIAARLQAETKILHHPILISAEVYQKCGPLDGVSFIDTEEIQVKGKQRKIHVYRVECEDI